MVTFSELRDADFSSLRTAADDWARLPKSLSGAGGVSHAWDKVSKGLNNSDWTGKSADAATTVMNQISVEIGNAGDEAFDVGKLLDDAHHRLSGAQKALKSTIVEINGPSGDFSIDDTGKITFRKPSDWQDNPEGLQFAEQRMGDYQRSLQQHVQDASDADEALYWALNQDQNGSDQGFNANAVSDIADAERGVTQARQDGRKAAELAKKGGKNLTDAQIEELNALMAQHRGDPEFGAAFATDLGPQGTLDLWAQVTNGWNRKATNQKDITDLQTNLSFALGDATRYHSPGMTDWENQMIAKGTDNVHLEGPGLPMPLGFQVMSSLMHQGHYDSGFLEKYGDALVTADKHVGQDPAGWNRFNAYSSLDPQGKNDPMSGFLDALGHNPQASLTFMDKNHFQYLSADRVSFLNSSMEKTSLGHALLSATTGHEFDIPANIDTPPHTQAQANLMNDVVNYYAQDGASDAQGPMGKDLGRMTAEYMPQFDQTLSGLNGSTMGEIFPSNGAQIKLNDEAATQFLANVGKNPDGYAAVSLGQAQYTTHLVNYHLTHPNAVPDIGSERAVQEVASRGATVQEILNHGRADAVVDDATASDASYNKALNYGSEWTKATLGAASGFAADAVTENPFVGPFVEKGVETGTGDVIDLLTSGLTRDTTDAANQNANDIMDKAMKHYTDAVYGSVISNNPSIPSNKIQLDLSDGFSTGSNNGARYYGDYVTKHGSS